MRRGSLWHYLPYLLFFLHVNYSSPLATLCSPEQSSALLNFRNTISIDSSSSTYRCQDYSYPKTLSWKEGSDCCLWAGVTCDRFTGHVIGLDLRSSWLTGTIYSNNTLFQLHHLQKLNLACNDFGESNISMFSQFAELIHLDLSSSGFSGPIPTEITHLSKLVSLDLSGNFFSLDKNCFRKILQNLTEMRYLHLDGVNMSLVAPSSLVNLSSSLISLTLSLVSLQGRFPTDVLHLPFLQQLDLSRNVLLTGNLPESNWSSHLTSLDLSFTKFSGKLPDTIGNIVYLNSLDLAYCNFRGSIPASVGNLTAITLMDLRFNAFNSQVPASLSHLVQLTNLHLQYNSFSGQLPDVFGNLSKLTHLDLSSNNFSGQLPSSVIKLTQVSSLDFFNNQFEGHIPSQVSNLSYLTYLGLSHNFLGGRIPSWLFTETSLSSLDLSNNKLTGFVDHFHPPSSLLQLNLNNNEIDGSIPNFVFELENLTELQLSSNNLSGVVMSETFSKLKNLEYVDLSFNSLLSLRTQRNVNFTLPMLQEFTFSSCNVAEFPIFLRSAENLQRLDLSNNKILGMISSQDIENWQKLDYLNLSHNYLTGFAQIHPLTSLRALDLEYNMLQGPLIALPPYISFVSVSNNNLTGEIPSMICNSSSLQYIDLSNNSLTGTIPECLGNFSWLSVLDLGMNKFQGSIPQIVAKSNSLTTLNLNGNQLEGALPTSLVNCPKLEILDVGNNKINDTFPNWLAPLPEMQVLIMRSNRFHGPITDSDTRFPFPKLRIIDLSHNGFTGVLPSRYLQSFNAMMHGSNNNVEVEYMLKSFENAYYSVTLTVKGVEMEMVRILNIFTTIDLSDNRFQGPIPEVVGRLISLKLLNFSHNILEDRIPLSLENLTELESLDLSSNKLVGEIPIQLINLTSLSVLNLSYNQLVGPIPQGRQFNTFQNDSYIGNSGLCGLPLSKSCSKDETPSQVPSVFPQEDNASSWFDWKVAMIGYGGGLVVGLSIGYIVFATRKPQWFVRMVERKDRQMYVRKLIGRRKGRRN